MKNQAGILAVLSVAAMLASMPLEAANIGEWNQMRHIVPRSYLCFRATEAPVIDGALHDKAWANAPFSDPFVDIIGRGHTRPRHRTQVKMMWDDEYLYIGAQLEEPHVWGTITQRDAVIFQDNDFEIFIDPNGDNHEYYELEINALNTLWDLFLNKPYKDGGRAQNEWDLVGVKTAVQVQGSLNNPKDRDGGWTVEMALPWKSLGEHAHRPSPPLEGDQWRMNFSRVQWKTTVKKGAYVKVPGRREDNWVWSAQGVVDMHRPEMWGSVQFTSLPPGKAKLLPDPTAYGRKYLYQAYYAQRAFQAHYNRFARNIDELQLVNEFNARHLVWPLTLTPTDDGYRVLAEVRIPGGSERWYIRQDGKLWRE